MLLQTKYLPKNVGTSRPIGQFRDDFPGFFQVRPAPSATHPRPKLLWIFGICLTLQSPLGAVQRKQFQKSEITMEVGGWVQVSLGFFVLENHPKIPLNQYRYFGVVYHVFCLYILYVGRNLWICAIHGWRCAIYGSILCTGIHGSRRNLWIALPIYRFFATSPGNNLTIISLL